MIQFSFVRKVLLCLLISNFSVISYCNLYAQMRQVYLDGTADNQLIKLSLYSPTEGYVAFNNWIGYTQDSGRSFAKNLLQPIMLIMGAIV